MEEKGATSPAACARRDSLAVSPTKLPAQAQPAGPHAVRTRRDVRWDGSEGSSQPV